MKIAPSDLEAAVAAGVLDGDQARRLQEWLAARYEHVVRFRPAHIIYYFGGFIAISAVSLFVTLAWDDWAGWPMLLLTLAFAGLGVALANWFRTRGREVPAGVMITFAVATTPLAVYSLQHALGFWHAEPYMRSVTDFHRLIDWRWFFMEFATLAAAAIALWRYRMPFLMMPVGIVLWYLSMDLVPLLFQVLDHDWHLRRLVTMHMGIITVGLAFWVDVRSEGDKDYAFWLYLFGALMFWCGLSSMDSDTELGKFLYFLVNVLMIAIGGLLVRRVFAVLGTFGVGGYLGHLATVFEDSLLFPVVLAAIGIGIVFVGLLWQRNEARIQGTLLGLLPTPVQRLVERAHGRV